MVNKRSFISIAGAVMLLALAAPMALSQTDANAPDAVTPVVDEPTVMLTQQELDSIHSQLAALTLRVDELEQVIGAAPDGGDVDEADDPTGDVIQGGTDAVDATVILKPKAPKATGDTSLRYADHDPDPTRGLVKWKDRATDEDGHRLYAKRVYCGLVPGADPSQALDYDDFTRVRSEFVRIGQAGADATAFRPVHQQVRSKLPPIPGQQYGSGEIYDIFVAAFNEAGESKKVKVGSYMTTPEFMCP